MIETIVGAALEVVVEPRSVELHRPTSGAHVRAVREAATPPPRWVRFARCVLDRESGANLKNRNSGEGAKNPRSSASGRWQFLDSQWRHGGSFMVRDRLVKFGMPKQEAKRVRQHLGDTPIRKWDGWWQDALFNEVVERGGWRHWSGGKGCNALVP